jgi:hypothetical protein
MATSYPLHVLRGPFNFLRLAADEIDLLFPDIQRTLPAPRPVFLEDEDATPVYGFPVLLSKELEALRLALEEHVVAEETVQTAVLRRVASDRQAQAATWERYRSLLARAVENVTLSSYGRNFPSVFWLHHSLEVARLLKETPRRVLRLDLEIGRRHGDTVRYRVLERFLDRVFSETYDLVTRLSSDTEEFEEELFPRLLTRLKDNVLLLTEDHVSHDLAELTGYFNGYLGIDGRDFRQRMEALDAWHRQRLEEDGELQAVVEHLVSAPTVLDRSASPPSPRRLLTHTGYVSFLSRRRDYRAAARSLGLPDDRQVEVWESLLAKLKEFELVHALRRMVIPTQEEGLRMISRGPVARALGVHELALSPTTRPLNFMAPWVVEPQVSRFGLIYDITDFSEIISVLRRSGSEAQDESFRKMFRLQRRINRFALARRLKLEKYLGDGAFYSGRSAARLLVGAIHVQRVYRQALEEGFPFDRGMRVALNYSQYRLIPIATAQPGQEERYEFFGHGLVELSRLTTGKALREIEDLKTMLVTQGYPEQTVHRFFAPMLHRDVDLVDKAEHSRRFYAYINRNGHLVNEGIVATQSFLREVALELSDSPLGRVREGDRAYVVVQVDDFGGGPPISVGLRSLGRASLKGLDPMPVYEVVDGADWSEEQVEPISVMDLTEAIEREVAGTLNAPTD